MEGDVAGGDVAVRVCRGRKYKETVLSAQFSREPKTVLKY